MWRPKLIVLQPTPYCNINCDYCYLSQRNDHGLMRAEVIDAIRDKVLPRMDADAAPTVIWHAGEPTVVPVDWYRRARDQLMRTAPAGLHFAVQSNGVAISDSWISFLVETKTHIGLSLDGPRAFHDLRRKTRSGKGTWHLVMASLMRLQAAGVDPSIVTVLHPASLAASREYFEFYRDHLLTHVSFSIDEAEGANTMSSFDGADHTEAMAEFLLDLLERAFVERFPLRIKEIERIAGILGGDGGGNEQVEPWEVLTIAANGDVTTFSPEFMETPTVPFRFRFGNILTDDVEALLANNSVRAIHAEIERGVQRCREQCKYFAVCGGGAPANKFHEHGRLDATETLFCRLSIQAAAEALRHFVRRGGSAAVAADSKQTIALMKHQALELLS